MAKGSPAARVVPVDGVGPVLFERSRRARRIIITVRPSGVRVALPFRVSVEQALDFVMLKKDWVRKHLSRIERHEHRRGAFMDSLAGIDRGAASARLKARTRYLAGKYGFACNRVTVRNQKTRWGSCSHDNNISLNIKLVLLPPELRDYVILHELVHTRFHDHSRRFWAELDRFVGDARACSRLVKKSGIDLL